MFRIGEFSRLSRVSIRMLRHYDQIGLLRPARVDPETGYRRYSAGQLPRLNRIVVLKDLGFGLEQIARLLAEDLPPDQVIGMLKLRRAELEQELAEQQARLAMVAARLDRLERGHAVPAYEVVVRRVEAQRVASIRRRVPGEASLEGLFEDLEVRVAAHRARAAGAPLTIYHDPEFLERDIDVEVAVPVSGPVPDDGRVVTSVLPAVETMACVVHTGDYRTIDGASNALLAWIEAEGARIAGPLREVYLRFDAGGLDLRLPPAYLAERSEDYVTELQLPVEKR